ncbi:MAG: NTP transferase domain-containing protein [Parachlamydiaceae bacterium]
MKVVILAAGLGSRLDSQSHCPKALTKLENGDSLLGWQLKILLRHIPLKDIIVVVGFHYESILTAFPQLPYYYNPHYEEENTAGSLRRALQFIEEDLLWLNGDVIFHPSVLKDILSTDQTCIAVNQAHVGDEEVKYRVDAQGNIIEVSKEVKDPQGEAIGINFFKKADLSKLKAGLNRCQPTDYFEKSIEFAIQEGLQVKGLLIPSKNSCEVDFKEDLEHANFLIRTWNDSSIAR